MGGLRAGDAVGVGANYPALGLVEARVDYRQVLVALPHPVAVREHQMTLIVVAVQHAAHRVLDNPGVLHDPDRIVSHRCSSLWIDAPALHGTYSHGITFQTSRRSSLWVCRTRSSPSSESRPPNTSCSSSAAAFAHARSCTSIAESASRTA